MKTVDGLNYKIWHAKIRNGDGFDITSISNRVIDLEKIKRIIKILWKYENSI